MILFMQGLTRRVACIAEMLWAHEKSLVNTLMTEEKKAFVREGDTKRGVHCFEA